MFQVLKDGKIYFQTKYPECVPPEEQIKAMKKAGYKIKVKQQNTVNSNDE
jgi:hypothetical protein